MNKQIDKTLSTKYVIDKSIVKERRVWKKRMNEINSDVKSRYGSILPGELSDLTEYNFLNDNNLL